MLRVPENAWRGSILGWVSRKDLSEEVILKNEDKEVAWRRAFQEGL